MAFFHEEVFQNAHRGKSPQRLAGYRPFSVAHFSTPRAQLRPHDAVPYRGASNRRRHQGAGVGPAHSGILSVKRAGPQSKQKRWAAFVAAGGALFSTGCPNPNTYQSARTIPAGEVAHTFGFETMRARVKLTQTRVASDGTETQSSGTTTTTVPTPPTYMLRVGALERLDFGLRLANMSSLGLDAKFNFVRGLFDVALDPGMQFYRVRISSGPEGNFTDDGAVVGNVGWLHAPLLLFINATPSIGFGLTPGISYAWASTDFQASDDIEVAVTHEGPSARLGIAVNVRTSERFSLQPELTMLRGLDDEANRLVFFGLGMNFGSLPDRSDLGGGAPAKGK
jgi:hypothetical protein